MYEVDAYCYGDTNYKQKTYSISSIFIHFTPSFFTILLRLEFSCLLLVQGVPNQSVLHPLRSPQFPIVFPKNRNIVPSSLPPW